MMAMKIYCSIMYEASLPKTCEIETNNCFNKSKRNNPSVATPSQAPAATRSPMTRREEIIGLLRANAQNSSMIALAAFKRLASWATPTNLRLNAIP
jgi:hypothetical protein